MSTHAAIIAKLDGTWKGIYVHFDGYLSGVGRCLHDHYSDPQKVATLISQGDRSSIHAEPDEGQAYTHRGGRLMIHIGDSPKEVEKEIDSNGNVYVWDGGWTVGLNGRPLARAIRGTEFYARWSKQKDAEMVDRFLDMEDALREIAAITTAQGTEADDMAAQIQGIVRKTLEEGA